jgi:hypothetical protein
LTSCETGSTPYGKKTVSARQDVRAGSNYVSNPSSHTPGGYSASCRRTGRQIVGEMRNLYSFSILYLCVYSIQTIRSTIVSYLSFRCLTNSYMPNLVYTGPPFILPTVHASWSSVVRRRGRWSSFWLVGIKLYPFSSSSSTTTNFPTTTLYYLLLL